jgi:hypothetical protein
MPGGRVLRVESNLGTHMTEQDVAMRTAGLVFGGKSW